MDEMLGRLAAMRIGATGEIGDADPIYAVGNTLRREGRDAFSGIILSTLPKGDFAVVAVRRATADGGALSPPSAHTSHRRRGPDPDTLDRTTRWPSRPAQQSSPRVSMPIYVSDVALTRPDHWHEPTALTRTTSCHRTSTRPWNRCGSCGHAGDLVSGRPPIGTPSWCHTRLPSFVRAPQAPARPGGPLVMLLNSAAASTVIVRPWIDPVVDPSATTPTAATSSCSGSACSVRPRLAAATVGVRARALSRRL